MVLFQCQVRTTGDRTYFVNLNDVGMLEFCDHLRLSADSTPVTWGAAKSMSNQLNGNDTVERESRRNKVDEGLRNCFPALEDALSKNFNLNAESARQPKTESWQSNRDTNQFHCLSWVDHRSSPDCLSRGMN